ncbi:hypothetical protein FQN54_008815 [Arachnomyces sp. PD_36]|nr:hypothetical protein FQN54_008815 [Arachnomyces sp. PD_36]
MKVTSLAAFALSVFSVTVAGQTEDPGPSPTESVGCEPHGDHWHCDGPVETSMSVTAPSEAETTSEDPGPSPTSSGCEPHGDHWHCPDPTATGEPSEDEHEHEEDATGTEDPGPSPTESAGCEPHGDHWHCDAPATGTSSDESAEATETGAAAGLGFDSYSLAGVFALAALFPAI